MAYDLPAAPDWLIGVWRRDSIELEDGCSDRTTEVFWGQTGNLFVDIRIPENLAGTCLPGSVCEYTTGDLMRLTGREGFAGYIDVDGMQCTWRTSIDFHPPTGRPDTAGLSLDHGILHEYGDASSAMGVKYHEVFRQVADGEDRRLALMAVEGGGSILAAEVPVNAILVVIDDHFFFARGNKRPLPPGAQLADLVDRHSGDPGAVRSLLDCEVSRGGAADSIHDWKIDRSTLPWREGEALFASCTISFDAEQGRLKMTAPEGWIVWKLCDSNLSHDAIRNLFGAV